MSLNLHLTYRMKDSLSNEPLQLSIAPLHHKNTYKFCMKITKMVTVRNSESYTT